MHRLWSRGSRLIRSIHPLEDALERAWYLREARVERLHALDEMARMERQLARAERRVVAASVSLLRAQNDVDSFGGVSAARSEIDVNDERGCQYRLNRTASPQRKSCGRSYWAHDWPRGRLESCPTEYRLHKTTTATGSAVDLLGDRDRPYGAICRNYGRRQTGGGWRVTLLSSPMPTRSRR